MVETVVGALCPKLKVEGFPNAEGFPTVFPKAGVDVVLAVVFAACPKLKFAVCEFAPNTNPCEAAVPAAVFVATVASWAKLKAPELLDAVLNVDAEVVVATISFWPELNPDAAVAGALWPKLKPAALVVGAFCPKAKLFTFAELPLKPNADDDALVTVVFCPKLKPAPEFPELAGNAKDDVAEVWPNETGGNVEDTVDVPKVTWLDGVALVRAAGQGENCAVVVVGRAGKAGPTVVDGAGKEMGLVEKVVVAVDGAEKVAVGGVN